MSRVHRAVPNAVLVALELHLAHLEGRQGYPGVEQRLVC